MKLSIATALLSITSAAAFAPSSSGATSSALRSTVTSEVYSFTKSNEIFEEAKTVRTFIWIFLKMAAVQYSCFLYRIIDVWPSSTCNYFHRWILFTNPNDDKAWKSQMSDQCVRTWLRSWNGGLWELIYTCLCFRTYYTIRRTKKWFYICCFELQFRTNRN